jgi:hypothetical protein
MDMKRFATESRSSKPAGSEDRPDRPAASARGNPLSTGERMLIFLELVLAQDSGGSVAASRASILQKFHLDPRALDAIEAEGVERDWPPL